MDQATPLAAGKDPTLSPRRERAFAILVPVVTIVLVLLLMEGVLRFLPVSTAVHTMPVNAVNPVLHLAPNQPFVNSLCWDMHNVVRGRVNNVGFINDQDYRRDDSLPLFAVIGDSYIEAKMVPYAGTVQGRLARLVHGRAHVYSFGTSGAPLSQYMIWAGYAVREFGAKAVVINVVGNDFDESLLAYKLGPGFWLYVPDEKGVLHLRLIDYRPGRAISLARHSALARYIIINLRVQDSIFKMRWLAELIFGKPAHAAEYYGNTDASAEATRVRDSLAAIDAFFRDLPEKVGLPPQNVLFTLDGFRYPGAIAAGRGSYFDLMRRAFLAKAQALGYEAIDLDPRFVARNAATGERFEFADDGHWNANGHGVAAEAVAASGVFKRLIP